MSADAQTTDVIRMKRLPTWVNRAEACAPGHAACRRAAGPAGPPMHQRAACPLPRTGVARFAPRSWKGSANENPAQMERAAGVRRRARRRTARPGTGAHDEWLVGALHL